jgi:hypothetical protein
MLEKTSKEYKYVGPEHIRLSVINSPIGIQIKSQKDFKNWIEDTKQQPNNFGIIEATFVIDLEGYLRIADRHSEHVACSGGKNVLSAGEIFIISNNNKYEVVEISNQSTGFCPESESWFWVEQALEQIPLSHPGEFTLSFIFRRCTKCNQLNIVKGNLFICAVCNTELPSFWNCEMSRQS